MIVGPLLFLAALALVHHPLMVSDDADPATLGRLQEHERRLRHEMGRLHHELSQPEWSWDPRQIPEYVAPSSSSDPPAAEEGPWEGSGWHYAMLLVLVLVGCSRYSVEKEPGDDSSSEGSGSSSSTTEDYDDDEEEDTDAEPEAPWPNPRALEAFYDRHVKVEPGDLDSMCEFVTSLVNDLLEACRRALPHRNTLPLLQNCIGVGSAFEGWHTRASRAYTVLVPVLPPKGHSFRVESSDAEGGPSPHGHILVETECACKRERLLGDVVCFLHHPEREPGRDRQGLSLAHVLCTSAHLDVEKTTRWFQELVAKAWPAVQQSYSLELASLPSDTACCLKLGLPSGRPLSVDIVLGVQQSDSLVFLATRDGETDRGAGTIWRKTFAVQELLFFKWARQRLPGAAGALRCLQTLVYFKESRASEEEAAPVLTGYHYKTCLMHLLLLRSLSPTPPPREPESFGQLLQDLLVYLHTALQRKRLPHFLIGNISLPIHIPLPQALRSAAPPNLFGHLAADPDLHAQATKEFAEVVERVQALWSEREE